MENNNNSNDPIILGTLRKEKSSKPIFVLFVFLLIVSATFGLPYIQKYMKNPNTVIGQIYGMFFEVDDNKGIDNKITKHTLNENTNITFNNIILSNVKINNNKVSYDLTNKTDNIIILDPTDYYFNIYDGENKLIKSIKLTGNVTKEKINNIHAFTNFKFKNIVYYGSIETITDFADIEINSKDANLICSITNNVYKYEFNNYQLKTITHNYKYDDIKDLDKYLEKFNLYVNKSKKINEITPNASSTIEKDVGFEYNVIIDLAKINPSNLGAFIDYNYYELNTLAKKVKYVMEAKGYNCV